MKYLVNLLILSLFLAGCDSEESTNNKVQTPQKIENKQPVYTFTTPEQQISYCIGLDQGVSIRKHFMSDAMTGKFDVSQVEKGISDYLSGNELELKVTEIDSVFDLYLAENNTVDESKVSKSVASYAYGLSEAKVFVAAMVSKGIDQIVVVDLIVKGLTDGINSNTPVIPLKEARIQLITYYAQINLKKGEDFLTQNAKRKDVNVLESGLQYEIFKKGNGKQPVQNDSVVIHYTGRFVDGLAFVSSKPSGNPLSVQLSSQIYGLIQGIELMKEGAEYRFFIPYALGYGAEGFNGVEPYSALVFDVELIKVK